MLKLYVAFSFTNFDLMHDVINFEDGFRFGMQNRKLYFNSSYKNKFGDNWKLETGLGFTNDQSNLKIIDDTIDTN